MSEVMNAGTASALGGSRASATRKDTTVDAYSPDFMPYWNALPSEPRADDERRPAGEDQALAELAERVLAARSIV